MTAFHNFNITPRKVVNEILLKIPLFFDFVHKTRSPPAFRLMGFLFIQYVINDHSILFLNFLLAYTPIPSRTMPVKSIIIGSERVISFPCPIQKGIEMYPNIAGRGYKNRYVRETTEKQIKKIGIFLFILIPSFINSMQTMGQKPFDL